MQYSLPTLSFTDYLAAELVAEERHEYRLGHLIAMPGESKTANTIALNCAIALRQQTHAQGFEVFSHDVRLEVVPGSIYRYPDVMLAPTEDNEDSYAVKTPTLIVEITSESSLGRDHGEKLREYCAIASLQYYLIVSQEERLIEVYSRSPQGWVYGYYLSDQTVPLPALAATLPLSQVYQFTQV